MSRRPSALLRGQIPPGHNAFEDGSAGKHAQYPTQHAAALVFSTWIAGLLQPIIRRKFPCAGDTCLPFGYHILILNMDW